MKQTIRAPGRRTAPGALRHNERERERRQLHQPHRWWFASTGPVDQRARNADDALARMVPPRSKACGWCLTDYGNHLWVDCETRPGFTTPASTERRTFTFWRHATP